MVPGWLKVYCYLVNHSAPGNPFRGTNEEIAEATHLHVGSVNRLLHWLKTENPPGIDHPYIRVEGHARKRTIRLLYIGFVPGSRGQAAGEARRRPVRAIACKGACPACAFRKRRTLLVKGLRPRPLLIQEFQRDLTLTLDLSQHRRIAREGRTLRPAKPLPQSQCLQPRWSMESTRSWPDSRRSSSARRLPTSSACQDPRAAIRIPASCQRLHALGLLASLESPELPPETPRVESIAPKVAAAPAPPDRPSIQGLADRCRRIAGPGPIETLARRLSEELKDPGSLDFYRKIGRRVRAGEIDPKRVWDGCAAPAAPGSRIQAVSSTRTCGGSSEERNRLPGHILPRSPDSRPTGRPHPSARDESNAHETEILLPFERG